jgi:hypothetical protein
MAGKAERFGVENMLFIEARFPCCCGSVTKWRSAHSSGHTARSVGFRGYAQRASGGLP